MAPGRRGGARRASAAVLALAFLALSLAAGCGGGPSPPDDYDVAEITAAQNTLRAYCRKRVTEPETARKLGASEEVELLLNEYREFPEGTFELIPGEKPTTMREVLEGQAVELGEERCDPRLAERIEEELARR